MVQPISFEVTFPKAFSQIEAQGNRDHNTSKKDKVRREVQPRPVNCFWAGDWTGLVASNEALQIAYIIQFKLSTDRDEGFLEVKEAEAND